MVSLMEVCFRLGVIAIFQACVALHHPPCSPGFDSELYVFEVSSAHLPIQRQIGKVVFDDYTGRNRILFDSADKRFKVDTDGTVKLKRQVTLHDGHKRFAVHAWDSQGKKHTVDVRLELVQPHHHHQHHNEHEQENHQGHQVDLPKPASTEAVSTVPVLLFPKSSGGLKRRKRDWIIPDIKIPENPRGPFPEQLVQIKTSHAKEVTVTYSITGSGADEEPRDLFKIDARTGFMYITKPLDREDRATYTLLAHALDEGGGKMEEPIEVDITVIDLNDNKPVFKQNPFLGSVAEASKAGTEFMDIVATDADEPGNANSDIRYKITSQDPQLPSAGMFSINPVTGKLMVNSAGLDKEKFPKYTLDIQAADMEGNGLTAFCKAIITVTDSNDHAPQFEQSQYAVSVPENKVGETVVKMVVTDGDDPNTEAWVAKFKIISGDTGGMFTIETDNSKQAGIIKTAKPLDFEAISKYTLVVAVENEVPFAIPLPTATAQVVINVGDVNEAPIFSPAEKKISTRENDPVDTKLVLYSATDPDTAMKQTVTYNIGSDPAGWLAVEKDTGVIKVKAPMDRESPFVKDGQYKALILAMDSYMIPATGTGTLLIQLEDVNDNAPFVEERMVEVCNEEPSPVLLTVTDKDTAVNGAPYRVQLKGDSASSWTTWMNGTESAIMLLLKSKLDQDNYTVRVEVSDRHGLTHASAVNAHVCNCNGDVFHCTALPLSHSPFNFGILRIILALFALVPLGLVSHFLWRKRSVEGRVPGMKMSSMLQEEREEDYQDVEIENDQQEPHDPTA